MSSSLLGNAQIEAVDRYQIDSLRQEYLAVENDSLKLVYLTYLARNWRYVDIDSSKYYLHEALRQHSKLELDPSFHAFTYNIIADIYRLEGRLDSATYYLEQGYNYFKEKNLPEQVTSIAPSYGNLLVKSDQTDRGILILNEAILIAQERADSLRVSFLYASLGNILQSVQKDRLRAKSIFTKALQTSKNLPNPVYQRINAVVNLGLAEMALETEKLDSAIYYANKAIALAQEVNYMQKIVVANNILSETYIKQNKYSEAKARNIKVLELARSIQHQPSILKTNTLIIPILLSEKKYNQAISQSETTLLRYKQHLTSESKKEIYSYMFDAYLGVGNTSKLGVLKDSILELNSKILQNRKEEINNIYDRIRLSEQRAENKLLLIKEKESQRTLRSHKLSLILLLISFLSALGWAITRYRLSEAKEKQIVTLEQMVKERTIELKQSNAELQQTNYELLSLSHIASHDLKEPIITIGAFANLIKHKLPKELQERHTKEFSIIDKRSRQVSSLIEDYARYISISKQDYLETEEIQLANIVQQVVEDINVGQNYSDSKIIYKREMPIWLNRSAIYFILKNLIENGLKFNTSKTPTVEITQENQEGSYIIRVKDNGIGIAAKHREEVFQLNKRLHNKSQYDGSGLGLSIVSILVRKLHGKLILTSAVDRGTTFELVFESPVKEYQ